MRSSPQAKNWDEIWLKNILQRTAWASLGITRLPQYIYKICKISTTRLDLKKYSYKMSLTTKSKYVLCMQRKYHTNMKEYYRQNKEER